MKNIWRMRIRSALISHVPRLLLVSASVVVPTVIASIGPAPQQICYWHNNCWW